MNILPTGAAGFIGARAAEFLLDASHQVVGIDNLNDAYDVRMKEHRLAGLERRFGLDGSGLFLFLRADITDRPALEQAWITGSAHRGGRGGGLPL